MKQKIENIMEREGILFMVVLAIGLSFALLKIQGVVI